MESASSFSSSMINIFITISPFSYSIIIIPFQTEMKLKIFVKYLCSMIGQFLACAFGGRDFVYSFPLFSA